MNKTDFNKWANDMIKRIDGKRIITIMLPPRNHCENVVMCYDKRTNKVGIARCHPKDRFNLVWGNAIAIARCLGIEVPKITVEKKLSEMKYGEKFIGPYGQKYYFVAKHPMKSGQCIVLRIVDNHALNFHDDFYEMVE